MSEFRVQQIDHVEMFVPDRYEAARWYEATLGLHIVPEFEFWANGPGGPLMIAAGTTKLALFAGAPRGARRLSPRRVPYGWSGICGILPAAGHGDCGSSEELVG